MASAIQFSICYRQPRCLEITLVDGVQPPLSTSCDAHYPATSRGQSCPPRINRRTVRPQPSPHHPAIPAPEAILQKAAPFVPLLDDSEPNFRKSITILIKSESVPLDDDRSFRSDVRLILYEDGRLTRALRFRETCTRGFGWEQEEEEELNYASAVSLYGLDAIASGLAGALKELPAARIVHQDLEERLLAMTKILEALQRTP